MIYCSGHTNDGYHGSYQHMILNLVRKGFIVFAFDPVGQGERLEYYDPKTGKNIVGGPDMNILIQVHRLLSQEVPRPDI